MTSLRRNDQNQPRTVVHVVEHPCRSIPPPKKILSLGDQVFGEKNGITAGTVLKIHSATVQTGNMPTLVSMLCIHNTFIAFTGVYHPRSRELRCHSSLTESTLLSLEKSRKDLLTNRRALSPVQTIQSRAKSSWKFF